MGFKDEFASRNFSIYGQWLGILSMILCFATGLSNIIRVDIVIFFGIVTLIFSGIILFLEVPLLLRICPTSPKFDAFIRKISSNWLRAAAYLAMSVFDWLSLLKEPTALIAAAVFLALTAIAYTLAALKKQDFVGSKTLGGHGVAQMIV